MAVDDSDYHETDSLILPTKTYFPLSIHVAHYQLRHYISSFEQDLVYYADCNNVYCLNVETKQRTLIATLHFESRCTASGYGWICVAGEKEGHFAAIKLDHNSQGSEVDASLPLGLATGTTGQRRRDVKPKQDPHYDRVGTQIVNSISIHKLPSEGSAEEDDVVAVLTNNDETVRIYSLSRCTQIARLDCPFAMNHAAISPDGSLMVAVGDKQKAFFYERRTRASSSGPTDDLPQSNLQSDPSWNLIATIPLHCPPTMRDIGYFTTAWSSSGHLCAMGSECGYITVIDTLLMTECAFPEDAIVNVIKSSRPDHGHGPGSVRTMLFSKQPWDLLIWSEDQGRMCAADLRSGLTSRQVIQLDSSEEAIQRFDITESVGENDDENEPDFTREIEYLRQYRRSLDAEGNAFGPVDTSIVTEHRGIHGRTVVPLSSDDDPLGLGLDPRERRILENLPVTTRRDGGPERAITPRSINYTLSAAASNPRETTSRDAEDRNIGHNFLSLDTLGDSLRDRYSDTERRYQPHRQSSVIVPDGRNANSTSSMHNGVSTVAARTQRSTSPGTYGYPLAEAAMDRARISSPFGPWVEFSSTAEMRRARQLARDRERASVRYGSRRGGFQGQTHDPTLGVRTAGLATSEDGRNIYVGAEDGIYVLSIDTLARKMFPAICPR